MFNIVLKVPGREELEIKLETDSLGQITSAEFKGIGNLRYLATVAEYRKKAVGNIKDLPLPKGTTTADLLIAEAVLKAKGEWKPVLTDEELCHCRSVTLAMVDAAILAGAHTPAKVSAWTSASTACGTCRPDVEAHLRFRLRSAS
jgi:bacterioferritin-associated ferredoxin